MADDLVQRLRMFAKKPQALSTDVARASVLGEAADALARKDAEIAELRKEVDRLKGANDVLAESHRWVSKQRERAEARVREAPVVIPEPARFEVAPEEYRDGASVEVPAQMTGKRVALVLLDTDALTEREAVRESVPER